jgi:hypothetical protein
VLTKTEFRLYIIRAEKFVVVLHPVDALLGKLECGKENRVDYAGAGHGDTERSVSKASWSKGLMLLLPRYIRLLKKWILGLVALASSLLPTRQLRW